VVFVRDVRAKLTASNNVMNGVEEVAVDCDWQVQARKRLDSGSRSGGGIAVARGAGEIVLSYTVLCREWS
jgi:hypothetical protein